MKTGYMFEHVTLFDVPVPSHFWKCNGIPICQTLNRPWRIDVFPTAFRGVYSAEIHQDCLGMTSFPVLAPGNQRKAEIIGVQLVISGLHPTIDSDNGYTR